MDHPARECPGTDHPSGRAGRGPDFAPAAPDHAGSNVSIIDGLRKQFEAEPSMARTVWRPPARG